MNDRIYFERRAEAELELAGRASHPNAVRAHYELANRYLGLVHGREPVALATGSWIKA